MPRFFKEEKVQNELDYDAENYSIEFIEDETKKNCRVNNSEYICIENQNHMNNKTETTANN